jgi:hypothetical protein
MFKHLNVKALLNRFKLASQNWLFTRTLKFCFVSLFAASSCTLASANEAPIVALTGIVSSIEEGLWATGLTSFPDGDKRHTLIHGVDIEITRIRGN